MKIAERRRPAGKDHMEIYCQERKNKEKRLEQIKQQLEQKEKEQCTFSPRLVASSKPVMPPKIQLNVDYANFITDN